MTELNLDLVKKHLRIDDFYTEEDEYIEYLIEVATQVVESHIDESLDNVCVKNGGELPSPSTHTILLFIGHLYNNREAINYASAIEIPIGYSYMLDLYKNYEGGRKQ